MLYFTKFGPLLVSLRGFGFFLLGVALITVGVVAQQGIIILTGAIVALFLIFLSYSSGSVAAKPYIDRLLSATETLPRKDVFMSVIRGARDESKLLIVNAILDRASAIVIPEDLRSVVKAMKNLIPHTT